MGFEPSTLQTEGAEVTTELQRLTVPDNRGDPIMHALLDWEPVDDIWHVYTETRHWVVLLKQGMARPGTSFKAMMHGWQFEANSMFALWQCQSKA